MDAACKGNLLAWYIAASLSYLWLSRLMHICDKGLVAVATLCFNLPTVYM